MRLTSSLVNRKAMGSLSSAPSLFTSLLYFDQGQLQTHGCEAQVRTINSPSLLRIVLCLCRRNFALDDGARCGYGVLSWYFARI